MAESWETFPVESWTQRTPALGRRLVRAIAIDVMVLAAFAVVGEFTVRTFLPGTRQFLYTRELTGGHPQVMNSRGMREREFPTQRPAGEMRILCIGNSTTRGAGVAAEDTYPKQLEVILNENGGGGRCFVINAGDEGQSINDAIDFLQKDGLELDPSLVVIGYSPSMQGVIARKQSRTIAAQLEQAKTARPGWSTRIKRAVWDSLNRVHGKLYGTYLYVFLDTSLRRELYAWRVLTEPLDRRAGEVFAYGFDVREVNLAEVEATYSILRDELARLKQLLADRQIPFLVVGIPNRYTVSGDPRDNERHIDLTLARIDPMQRVASICDEVGIVFIDPTARLAAARQEMLGGTQAWEDLYVPMDLSHLNRQGLAVVAEELYKAIRTQRLVVLADPNGDGA